MTHTEALRLALDALERHTCNGLPCVEQTAVDAIRAALAAPSVPSVPSVPVAWQWRREGEPWTLDKTFNSQVYATTPDSEVRPLYAAPQPAPAGWRLVPVDETCERCGGAGHIEVPEGRGPDVYFMPAECPKCSGTGAAPAAPGGAQ
jgi:hypothetical protein